MAKTRMKIFTIIKEESTRIPGKNFIDLNGKPLWWHLLSELNGLDVTINTDSPKFLKQLQNYDLNSIKVRAPSNKFTCYLRHSVIKKAD